MTDGDQDRDASFEAALAATRRHFDGESPRAHDTERRVLASARVHARPRRALWLAPLAAAFVVSAAFAGPIGEQLAALKTRFLGQSVAPPEPPSPPDGAGTSRRPAAPPAVSVAEALVPVPAPAPEEASPAASASAASPVATPPDPAPSSRRTPNALGSARAPAPAAVPADELSLYKAAHRAHFAEQDYAAALAGWDRYLAAAPRGTFTLEARYNRAIALHRLGHRAAAITALRPFADGAYGRYRQEEARQLIEQSR